MADSFGVYIESATITRSFKNGVQVERWVHPARTGTGTWIGALADTPSIGAHIGRVEWWDEYPTVPGATLLDSHDFDDLSTFTTYRSYVDTTSDPGRLYIVPGAFSAGVVRDPQPVGTKYVELQNVEFSGPGDGWAMVSPYQEDATIPAADYGQTGYRLLLRRNGVVQFVDATTLLDPGPPLGPGFMWVHGMDLATPTDTFAWNMGLPMR